MKSASEVLHGLLMKEEVGFKFTKQTIEDMAVTAGMDVSEGVITGFIHRCVRFGRAKIVGKVKGNQGRMLHQYEIVDREPWGFKDKTNGSPKGRQIGNKHYNPVPADVPEPEMKISIRYPVDSLFMRLFDLAAEVEALEKKSLKDYSTDEIIAELKRRVK